MEKNETKKPAWVRIAQKGGFELFHRVNDSSALVDNFTIRRGPDSWRLSFDGEDFYEISDARILRSDYPVLRQWALNECRQWAERRLRGWQIGSDARTSDPKT